METWTINYGLIRCSSHARSICIQQSIDPKLTSLSNKKTSFLAFVCSNFAVVKLVDVENKVLKFIFPVSLGCSKPPSSNAVK